MTAQMTKTEMADACVDMLDTPLIRALSEPARLQIIRQLVLLGCADIKEIAATLPQDRSVIPRHLQLLEEAGIVRAHKEGRHVLYEVDGPAFADKIEAMAHMVRDLAPLCCPGDRRV